MAEAEDAIRATEKLSGWDLAGALGALEALSRRGAGPALGTGRPLSGHVESEVERETVGREARLGQRSRGE